jgi:GNAT superfamily N-acetyltransferase
MSAGGVVVVRAYRPGDRAAVRQLCCDTADRGGPVETLFHDRELIADLVTRYYTDFEPGSCWVAEDAGTVVGYATGTLSNRRHARLMAWRIAPAAVARAAARGALVRGETWRMLFAQARGLWRHGPWRPGQALQGYPAHVHVNVRDGYRGQSLGRRLLGEFLDLARRRRRRGVYARVRGDNPAGCAFFERMGYERIDGYTAGLLAEGRACEVPMVIYGKRLDGSAA